MGDDEIWVVAFYVPWCPHALRFAPEMEQSANDLRDHGYKIKFGAVDVSTQHNLGWRYKIDKSPIVKIFYNQNGQWIQTDYVGQRNANELTAHMHGFHKDNSNDIEKSPADMTEEEVDSELETITEDNFNSKVQHSPDIWMLKFSAPWCHHCTNMKPNWISAAKELGSKVKFGIIDADANRGLAKRFGVTMLPSLKFYEAGMKTDYNLQDYTGGRSGSEIADFAHNLYLGRRDHFGQSKHKFNDDDMCSVEMMMDDSDMMGDMMMSDGMGGDMSSDGMMPGMMSEAMSNGDHYHGYNHDLESEIKKFIESSDYYKDPYADSHGDIYGHYGY